VVWQYQGWEDSPTGLGRDCQSSISNCQRGSRFIDEIRDQRATRFLVQTRMVSVITLLLFYSHPGSILKSGGGFALPPSTCTSLRAAGIPFKVTQRKHQVFWKLDEHYEIWVLAEFYDKAKAIAESGLRMSSKHVILCVKLRVARRQRNFSAAELVGQSASVYREIPRQQYVDAVDGMLRDARQHLYGSIPFSFAVRSRL
jgi:hypothetical protein